MFLFPNFHSIVEKNCAKIRCLACSRVFLFHYIYILSLWCGTKICGILWLGGKFIYLYNYNIHLF
jgi:hypothetical protein